MAGAGPRGAIAIGQVHLLDSGRLEDLRFLAESNIDDGLTQWYRIDKSALRPALNVLSGWNVIPEYEVYARRLAEYRKRHPSPLDDPAVTQRMLEGMAAKGADPAIAQEAAAGLIEHRRIVREMVQKYGDR